jgi:hypothetical protein
MDGDTLELELTFSGELWYWRGPSPVHFVTVPDESSAALRSMASLVTYGWGTIPVSGRIGGTDFTTALFPKDGLYVVPVKDVVRRSEELAIGDTVTVYLVIRA